LPKGKIEAVDEPCPKCGMPQVKVTAFRSKPRTVCIDPNCESNQEPDVVVGICPTCTDRGIMDAKLIAQRNPRTLKRFIRCENYEECGTSYPLPQYGTLTPTDEVCESCYAPMVIVTTSRGPWKLCPNFSCPSKSEEDKVKRSRARSGGKGAKRKSTRGSNKKA